MLLVPIVHSYWTLIFFIEGWATGNLFFFFSRLHNEAFISPDCISCPTVMFVKILQGSFFLYITFVWLPPE